MKTILILLLLTGCATTQRVAGPSTSGVEARITSAQKSNTEAQKYNDLARGTSQRIEAKASVLEKYWDTSK